MLKTFDKQVLVSSLLCFCVCRCAWRNRFTLVVKGHVKNKHHNYNSEAKTKTYSDSNRKQLYVSDAVTGSKTVTILSCNTTNLTFVVCTNSRFFLSFQYHRFHCTVKKKHSVKITECKTTFLKKSPSLSPSIIFELGILVGGTLPHMNSFPKSWQIHICPIKFTLNSR